MIDTPITLYSENLIDSSCVVQTNSNITQITFTEAKQLDCILLTKTAITNIQIDYKTTLEQATWTEGFLLTQNQKEDQVFIFPSQITAIALRLTFNINADFENILTAKKLITLENILSSYSLDNVLKGNSYYTAGGNLVCWQEYAKKKLNLNLSNISQTMLEQIKNILKTNTFLTYVLFGNFDGYFAGEFALKETPVYNLNRQSALYSLNLTLLER